jgi:FMN phosphatase YigB (HAD superfamily)
MKIIVVDLDGTVCDTAHRDHLAQAKQWDEFHAAAKDDRPRADVAFFLSVLARRSVLDGILLVACTGRNERYRQTTLEWLIKHDLAVFDGILMRSDGDWRPDVEVKPALLQEFLDVISDEHGPAAEVAFILEDRDKVVEAWRNLGYCCWQVQATGW